MCKAFIPKSQAWSTDTSWSHAAALTLLSLASPRGWESRSSLVHRIIPWAALLCKATRTGGNTYQPSSSETVRTLLAANAKCYYHLKKQEGKSSSKPSWNWPFPLTSLFLLQPPVHKTNADFAAHLLSVQVTLLLWAVPWNPKITSARSLDFPSCCGTVLLSLQSVSEDGRKIHILFRNTQLS